MCVRIVSCAVRSATIQLNGCEIRKGRKVGVTISHNNHRLFVGNIPKNRDGHQLYQDFDKFARKLLENEIDTNKRTKTKQTVTDFFLRLLPPPLTKLPNINLRLTESSIYFVFYYYYYY